MPLFGSSSEFKDAKKALTQLPQELRAEMEKGNTRAAEQYLLGLGYSAEAVNQIRDQYVQGIGSPEDARATGARVMPGVDDLITRRADRISGQQADYNSLPSAQSTIDNRGAIQDVKDSRIGQNFDDIQGAIDTGFGSQRTRTGDTADRVASDTNLTYQDEGNKTSNAINDQIKYTGAGFGAIGDNAAKTFGGVRDRINQGRDAELGTTARAFAPAMAATLRRLRASGIDPNSSEGASLLQRVDSARGHAFDDSMRGTLSQLNQADLAQQSNQQGLDLSKLSNEQMLALQNAANKQNMSLQSFLQRVEQAGKTRDLLNSLDSGNMQANIGNTDTAFSRGQDAYTDRQKNELISRGINIDDFGNRVALSDKANNNDLTALDLKNAEFGAGAGYTAQDLARRDRGTAALANAGQGAQSTSATQSSLAQGAGQGAQQGWQGVYDRESASNNVLPKFFGGLATAAVEGAAGGLTGGAFGSVLKKKPAFVGNSTGAF